MSIWDNPDLQPPSENYVKLETEGDGFIGSVTNVMAQHFDDGSVAPQITFISEADGEEYTWTAGQIQAKRQLAELRPERGDRIRVRLVRVEKRGGGKTLKHLEIEVLSRADNTTQGNRTQQAVANVTANGNAFGNGGQAAGNGQQTLGRVFANNSSRPVDDPWAATAPAGTPPVPEGVDPDLWGRMNDSQRIGLLAALGTPPPENTIPPVPEGVNPEVWQRMNDQQRQETLKLLGGVPAF